MALIDDILNSLNFDSCVQGVSIGPRAAAVWSQSLGLAYLFPKDGDASRLTTRCEWERLELIASKKLPVEYRCGIQRSSASNDGIRKGYPRSASPQDEPGNIVSTAQAASASASTNNFLKDQPSARELATLAHSENSIEAAIGVASISSLINIDRGQQLLDGNAYSLLLKHGAGKNVTLVGHFSFVEKLRDQVRNLWVLELQPQAGDLPADAAPQVIPESEVVVITGASLINHSLEPLLRLARGRYVMLLGASTVLSSIFFDYGVSAVCGIIAVKIEEIFRQIPRGTCFRRTDGLRKVMMIKR